MEFKLEGQKFVPGFVRFYSLINGNVYNFQLGYIDGLIDFLSTHKTIQKTETVQRSGIRGIILNNISATNFLRKPEEEVSEGEFISREDAIQFDSLALLFISFYYVSLANSMSFIPYHSDVVCMWCP